MTAPTAPSTADRDLARLPNDRPFSYVFEGPKDARATFLLVHGLPGSARDFRWLAPVLAERARVVRLEMPGFGETPLSTEPDPSVEARGAFVRDAARALGLERPWLVGHSMGGVVGAMAATQAPEELAGLALVSSPGLREHVGFRKARPRLAEALLAWPGAERVMRAPMRRLFASMGFRHGTDQELRHTLRCVSATDVAAHGARVRRLRLPLLTAFCEGDPLIERAIYDELAEVTRARGPVIRFGDGGHNPQKHQAVELGAALLAWSEGTLR